MSLTKFCGKAARTGQDPAESAIMLTTDPDGLEVESRGPHMWGVAYSEAEVINQGQVAVSGDDFYKVISNLSVDMDTPVEIADAGHTIEITALKGRVRFEVGQLSLADYSGRLGNDDGFTTMPPDVVEYINLCKFAAAPDTRPNLSGIHIHPEGLAATDSYQFVLVSHKLPDVEPVTITKLMVDHLPDASSFGQGDIGFASDGNLATFKFGESRYLHGATIAADFVPLSMLTGLIPEAASPYMMELPVSELKRMNSMFKAAAGENTSVNLYPDKTMGITIPDRPSASYNFECEKFDIPETITFQAKVLNEVEKLTSSDETAMFRFSESSPANRPFVVERGPVILGVMPRRI